MPPKLYTPEVRRLMIDMVAQSRRNDSGALMAAIYHYLFGDPENVAKIVTYWFAVLHSRVTLCGAREMEAQPERVLAKLLAFLSEAPAAPCVRSHQVGEDQHHLVFFMPFGCARAGEGEDPVVQPCNLMVPIVHTDPRIIHAFNTIIMDRGAFTHGEEDPVYQYVTFSCFAYTKAAGAALAKYRKVLVASAIRTLVECIRGDIMHSDLEGAAWCGAVPSYKQAEREALLIDRVWASVKAQRPQSRVLETCFKYVVLDSARKRSRVDETRVRAGTPLSAEQVQLFTYPYVDLPSNEAIMATFLPPN